MYECLFLHKALSFATVLRILLYTLLINCKYSTILEKFYFLGWGRPIIINKFTKIIAAVLIAGQLAIPVFADTAGATLSPPEFSVVIGSNVYTLDYANDPINQAVISDAIVHIGNGKIYVQTVRYNWIDNQTGMTLIGIGENNVIVTSINGSPIASETYIIRY